MPLLNAANLQVLFQGLNVRFNDAMRTAPDMSLIPRLVTEMESLSAAEVYGVMFRTIGWREWPQGVPRNVRGLKADEFRAVNLTWESTSELPFQQFLDDHLGLLNNWTVGCSLAYLNYQLRLICQMMIDSGHKCIVRGSDGEYAEFFGAAGVHKYGDHDIVNLDTTPFSKAAYVAARTLMAGYRFDNGDYCYSRPRVIICGPALEQSVRETFEPKAKTAAVVYGSNTAAAAPSNILEGEVEIVVRPEFSANAGAAGDVDARYFWALVDTYQPIRPFMFQNRMAPIINMTQNPDDVLKNGVIQLFGTARGAYVPTLPHLIHLSRAAS
jgi:phage major head subunit gpT-like protein